MERYRLKIKLKASTTKIPASDNPYGSNTGQLFGVDAATETEATSEEDFLRAKSVTMKRKRGPRPGHKKGKQKEPLVVESDAVSNSATLNAEEDSGLDDIDDCQLNSAMDIEEPSLKPNRPTKVMTMDVDGSSDRPVGRVKVKLRSKVLESHQTYFSDQTQSDTDKSNPQMLLDKHEEVPEKLEDSANSLPEMQATILGSTTKKAGSIKIISSKAAVIADKHVSKPTNPVQMQGDRNHVQLGSEKTIDSLVSREPYQRETKLSHQDHRHKENELNAALSVIKEIMKMDASEPFNTPVDPAALGIPDYFDIIDHPMDFGTICHYLEHGVKYKSSEDVFKDVQFIWKNCYRYNSKGNYILDLMKCVKKNFTRCWMAAGLYCEPQKKMNGAGSVQDANGLTHQDECGRDKAVEVGGGKTNIMTSKQETLGGPSSVGRVNGIGSIHVKDGVPSNRGKVYTKGSSSKQKMRKRHGINHHKSGCLCAVCILMRRRREREENARMQKTMSDDNLTQEFKQEENSPLDNPESEDVSLNMDCSPELDADDDIEEQEDDVKFETSEQEEGLQQEQQDMSEDEMGVPQKGSGSSLERVLPNEGTGEDSNEQSRAQEAESLGFVVGPDEQRGDRSVQLKEEPVVSHEEDVEQKPKEATEKQRRAKILEDPLFQENPLILQMCRTLYTDDPRSVWSGPHSLVHRHVPARSSAIHAALSTFMK